MRQRHVSHGLDIINVSRWLSAAAEVVRSHHERFGGAGYPQGLRGEEIPLSARIFAVVDVFDAVTTKRPYKEAMPVTKAKDMLRDGRRTQFDPHIVDAFLPIAETVYRQVNESADSAKAMLEEITGRYFLG